MYCYNNNAKISNFCLPKQDELNKITLLLSNICSGATAEKLLKQLQVFVDLVLEENKRHNIIGKNTQQNIWTRHILDSLQLTHFINNNHDDKIIDFGSGAGFPAIPLAIVLDAHITCVEKSAVKAKFLQNIKNKLNLTNTTIINTTINCNNSNTVVDNDTVVVSRAFKSIDKMLQLLQKPILERKIKKIVIHKGQLWQKEIDNTPLSLLTNWKITDYPSLTGEGVILVFEQV